MFISKTRFNLKPPFKSEISEDLVKLYRFFLGRKDPTKIPITIRKSLLEPRMIVVEIPVYSGSSYLRPVEDLLEEQQRKGEMDRIKRLLDFKRKK